MSQYLDEGLKQFDEMFGLEPEEAPEEGTTEPAAEAPAETTPEPEAEAEAPTTEERQRDEKGRFTKAEEAAEPEVEETAEEQAERLLAGKFKSPEELERAYTELQSLIGKRLEPEDLRDALSKLDDLPDRLAEKLTSYEEDVPAQIDPVWANQQIEEDPARFSYWAKDNAPHLLGRAVQAWGEEDPFAAAQFVTDVRLAAAEQKFEQRLQAQTQKYEQSTRQSNINDAFAAVSAEIPDIAEYAQGIMEAAKLSPETKELLKSDSADERERAVKTLYHLARSMSGLQPQAPAPAETATEQPAQDNVQAAADAVNDVKLSGTVASQTQTGDPEKKTSGELWLDGMGFDAFLDSRTPE